MCAFIRYSITIKMIPCDHTKKEVAAYDPDVFYVNNGNGFYKAILSKGASTSVFNNIKRILQHLIPMIVLLDNKEYLF